AGRDPAAWPGRVALSGLRLDTARRQARALCLAAHGPLRELAAALQASPAAIGLTDGHGVVLEAAGAVVSAPGAMDAPGLHVGTDWSEAALGTNAVALALAQGSALQVRRAEHFYEAWAGCHGAAAPVLDVRGQVVGTLLLMTLAPAFGFDPVAVASQYASAIENQLLRQQADVDGLLEFQTSPDLLGTPLAALLGVDARGQVCWLNGVARRLTGWEGGALPTVQALLGEAVNWPATDGVIRPLCLPSGLTVWLRGSLRAPERAATPVIPRPEAADEEPLLASPRLADASRALIDQTLAACGGNVSLAAKRLGISRGRIYRHLQALDKPLVPATAERNPS
ncbi:helix-turn-helix domain-containing protein, partial [Ideonella sp. B508-1]|uniref:helix-turn-helix domain-containing protein n=1 Tax=Ideonella sp. B508-1 TaxID=137716 RepID=UPI0003B78DF9